MAVGTHEPITEFEDWYIDRQEDERDGSLAFRATADCASALWSRWLKYKTEMDQRVADYYKLEMLVDGEVISKKPDLPNISSGEASGMIRRMARNLVQHTPNVDIISKFDDDAAPGIFTRHILRSKVIGDDKYTNDMQQNLFASAKMALGLGFDCVIPVLLQDAQNGWYVKYDSIHYRDVFPEPGARDIRDAHDVFVRRYLTAGDIASLIRNQTTGWDIAALRSLIKGNVPPRQRESVDHQSKKHHTMPEGYEVITWYSDSGEPFLTFSATEKTLLRIEKNKHPLKWHPVFFMVMEKDLQQPLGKSQVELILGRQEFQDLLLNGAMKLWYRNINPPIFGFGTLNATPNLGPGKYTQFSNPNSKIETFEVNTQTLLQYGQISQQNAGNMIQQVGAADQQMASQGTGGMMSQTSQGVEAQQQMVDITTNNYQKAIENFFSRYCSYALTIYFQELKSVSKVSPTADTRQQLISAGLTEDQFDDKGDLEIDFADLATEYFVRAVPGSLVELEDEKQLRVLNELFVPLSQAMPALANAGDPAALQKASAAMLFIIEKQLELSGSAHSTDLKALLKEGPQAVTAGADANALVEARMNDLSTEAQQRAEAMEQMLASQQEQLGLLREANDALMSHLGIPSGTSADAAPATVS